MAQDNAPMEIRLTVQAMKYSVIHAFAAHSREVEEQIGLAVDAALRDFDFVALVKEQAEQLIREAVKGAIATAVSSVMWEEPIRTLIENGAAEKVKKAIQDSLRETS